MMISSSTILAEIAKLFEEPNTEVESTKGGYQDFQDHKAMTVYKSKLDVNEKREIVEYAKKAGLAIVEYEQKTKINDLTLFNTYHFVLKLEDFWRIPAYLKYMDMMKNHYIWNDSAEHFERILLGYTEPEIVNYIESRKRTHGFWGLQAVYIVMTREYCDNLRHFGYKCFNLPSKSDYLGLVFDSLSRGLKTSVFKHENKEFCIGRFGLKIDSLREIFDLTEISEERPALSVQLDNKEIVPLNQVLRTNIQLFSNGSWT